MDRTRSCSKIRIGLATVMVVGFCIHVCVSCRRRTIGKVMNDWGAGKMHSRAAVTESNIKDDRRSRNVQKRKRRISWNFDSFLYLLTFPFYRFMTMQTYSLSSSFLYSSLASSSLPSKAGSLACTSAQVHLPWTIFSTASRISSDLARTCLVVSRSRRVKVPSSRLW